MVAILSSNGGREQPAFQPITDLFEPDLIPPKLASMSTKAGTNHTTTSPDGRNAATPAENNRKRKRQSEDDKSPTPKTAVDLRPAEKGDLIVAVIEKWHNPCAEREIQLLLKLQGCSNIVQLLNYESLYAADSWRLVEERLVEFPEKWKHFRAEQGMPAACQYLLDGVMALNALLQNRIIHREFLLAISCGLHNIAVSNYLTLILLCRLIPE